MSEANTVAILAQGTHWAVALAQAFLHIALGRARACQGQLSQAIRSKFASCPPRARHAARHA